MRGRRASVYPPAKTNVFGRALATVGALAAVMLAGGLLVGVLASEKGPLASHNSSNSSTHAELTHIDDDFSISADSREGTLRITEADGRTLELSFDPEMIREAAKNWPEMAGRWREAVIEQVGPVVAAASQSPTPPLPPATGERWLVVDQLGGGVDPEQRARVHALFHESSRDVEWVTTGDELGLELVSRATAAIGIGTPSDPKTINRLRSFLSGVSEIDGLVWLVDNDGPRALTLSLDDGAAKRMKRRLKL